MTEERVYAWDKTNGQAVYRIPGHQHGDGQVDTDDNPVWLLANDDDLARDQVDVYDLPEIAVPD